MTLNYSSENVCAAFILIRTYNECIVFKFLHTVMFALVVLNIYFYNDEVFLFWSLFLVSTHSHMCGLKPFLVHFLDASAFAPLFLRTWAC